MLVLAAAAIAEVPAFRGDSIRRWLDDAEQSRPSEAFFHFGNLDFDYFADLNEWDEESSGWLPS